MKIKKITSFHLSSHSMGVTAGILYPIIANWSMETVLLRLKQTTIWERKDYLIFGPVTPNLRTAPDFPVFDLKSIWSGLSKQYPFTFFWFPWWGGGGGKGWPWQFFFYTVGGIWCTKVEYHKGNLLFLKKKNISIFWASPQQICFGSPLGFLRSTHKPLIKRGG